MTKKERVYIRVTKAQKERLQKMAQKENRSLSNYILTVVENHTNKEEKTMNKNTVREFVEKEIWENLVWEGMEAILYKDGETFVRQEGSAGTDEDDIIYKVSLSSSYWSESYALDWDEESEEYIKDESMKKDFIEDIANEILDESRRRV